MNSKQRRKQRRFTARHIGDLYRRFCNETNDLIVDLDSRSLDLDMFRTRFEGMGFGARLKWLIRGIA